MPDTKRWKAVATYRHTHDKVVSEIGYFDEIDDIAPWIEGNYDWRALDSLVVTYNLTNENLTLTQIAAEDWQHVNVVAEETPVAN